MAKSSQRFHCPSCKSTLFHARIMKRGLELSCWSRECGWTQVVKYESIKTIGVKGGAKKKSTHGHDREHD